MKRAWTEPQRKRVKALAAEGKSSPVIAQIMSREIGEPVHSTAIARLIHPPKGPYTPEDDRFLIDSFRASRKRGENLEVAKKQIAAALKRTPQSVDARLRLLGEIDLGDQRDYVEGTLKPWPAKGWFKTMDKDPDTDGNPRFYPARRLEYTSSTGNSGGMLAESRPAARDAA